MFAFRRWGLSLPINALRLKFKREYLNGKRNGKGKEYYYYDYLKFEGEYLNGKINGKGKEYNYYGQLLFEGEYLNGKKWNGKIYNNGRMECEIKDGKGYIEEYYENCEIKFEGEYSNFEIIFRGVRHVSFFSFFRIVWS